MEHFIYQTTNLITGFIYIGAHSGSRDDSYLGSGKYLKAAITKYGLENFNREILETFDGEEQMYLREVEIVNPDFVSRADTYNLKPGGKGGWKQLTGTKLLVNDQGTKIRVQRTENVKGFSGNTKGLKYFNDGVKTFRLRVGEEIPSHLKPGRAWKASGRKWFNDGKTSLFIEPSKAGGLTAGRLCTTGRKWFNDGERCYFLHPTDKNAEKLQIGRLKFKVRQDK